MSALIVMMLLTQNELLLETTYFGHEQSQQETVANADVVVYGSTPGGFCAAIAAAREGASVILVEPTDHIGGLSTGGLSHCDSNQTVRKTLIGLFEEWHSQIVKDYTDRGLPAPYNPTIKDQSRWTFEPHVARRVTLKMLKEAGVTLLTERYIRAVEKTGPRINSLVTNNGTFKAKVFVDASYEGDLMAAANIDWTIGREGPKEFGESYAGQRYPKQKLKINGFDDQGKPLPLVTSTVRATTNTGDINVMTYSFRLCLTEERPNRIPMPKPKKYDPKRFEIVRRAIKAGVKRYGFDLYPLPGKKLDGNNSIGGQFSIGLVGGGTQWHLADQSGRQEIWEAHKQYTLEFFHFLTSDPAVPAAIRNRYSRLGLCKDEFADHNHFSPALYVRESRRLKGIYIISQKDILESPIKRDPIAISSFPIDSHDCQRVAVRGEGVFNEGTIFPVRRGNSGQGFAYHVPYRSVLPKSEQCDNLLVPVALSCTHVGISSLRIEGTWMAIGQGAGIAAALAAKSNLAVQKLDYLKLRERLLAQKMVLDLPEPGNQRKKASISIAELKGIVLDDADAILKGTWKQSTTFKSYVGRGYRYTDKADPKESDEGFPSATFRFKVKQSGQYNLRMAYSSHASRSRKVRLTVKSGKQSNSIMVDQTKTIPDNSHFRKIGTIHLVAGQDSTIEIKGGEPDGFVILDALQLIHLK